MVKRVKKNFGTSLLKSYKRRPLTTTVTIASDSEPTPPIPTSAVLPANTTAPTTTGLTYIPQVTSSGQTVLVSSSGQMFILVPSSTSPQTFVLIPAGMMPDQTPSNTSTSMNFSLPSTSNARTSSIEVIDISDDEMEVINPTQEEPRPSTSQAVSEYPSQAVPELHDNFDEDAIVNWILVEDNGVTRNNVFHRTEKKAVFKVEHNMNRIQNIMEYQEAIDNAFGNTMRAFFDGSHSSDRFTALIENTSPETPIKPIYIRLQQIKAFDQQSFLNLITMVAQSNANVLLDGLLKVRVAIYSNFSGSMRCVSAPQTYERIIKKGSVIHINNKDNSCGYRAIVCGKKFHRYNQNDSSREWQ